MMLSKRRSGRHGRSFGKLARIAVAGGAAAVALGTIGVTGASAGHSTLNATVGCQEESWSLNFDGSFYAAPFINLVRIRLLDGPAEALAEVPAAGYWEFLSHPNPNPPDFDHSVLGTVNFGLTFPKTLSTATLTFQINFYDLHLGVPGPPIEHPDTDLTRTITRTNNCFQEETTTTAPTTTTTTTTIPTTPPPTNVPDQPPAVHAIEPLCISDAPYIDVTFGPETRYAGLDAHITFIDVNGNVVGSHTAPYVPNGTVRFVYPGATVDAAGNATDWPGWKLAPNGNWIPDSSDQHLREGLIGSRRGEPDRRVQGELPARDLWLRQPAARHAGEHAALDGY